MPAQVLAHCNPGVDYGLCVRMLQDDLTKVELKQRVVARKSFRNCFRSFVSNPIVAYGECCEPILSRTEVQVSKRLRHGYQLANSFGAFAEEFIFAYRE